MKINFITDNLPTYMNDVPEVIRAFSPHITLSDDGELVTIFVSEKEGSVSVAIQSDKHGEFTSLETIDFLFGSLEYKRLAKRCAKKLLYSLATVSYPSNILDTGLEVNLSLFSFILYL